MARLMRGLTAVRMRTAGRATCVRGDLRPDASRERCRLHALYTGHRVLFIVADVTVYELAPR
jgi:hypothetical protein